jgi:multidrug efflux pump
MLAHFFIDRPVLAWVISIIIILLGTVAAVFLPIAEYPEVSPPTVRVTANYPGANAQVVADTVAAPIEQQVVGVENMLYMTSQSNNDGSYTLDVTFALGTDVNMAQVPGQNREVIAEPTLPDVVRSIGVAVKKRSPDVLLAISLYSDDDPETGRPYYDRLYMSNYATIQIKDAVSRLEGVGDVFINGQQDYSMRIWLDPDRLQSRGLTVDDVIKVLREQNVQVAAGQIGQPPVPKGQDIQYTLSTLGRLVEPEQFANIVLKTGASGEVTYLRDVSRTELGARSQDTLATVDRRPSVALAVFLLPGSNALDTADRIKAKMRELERRFPRGLRYGILYDTTPFIRESVDEVFHTLIESVVLVAAVILLFLQDWKALLLPVIDMGVSLVGTFVVMKLMGFTFNTLTLFGLVLAIGIVVDDAIVVLENIERWLEKGLPVREATLRAMNEITGPILAITLVLSSVLLPSAFLGGITGQFFKQFALTISASMLISAVNAMTMTPARAAWIFGSRSEDRELRIENRGGSDFPRSSILDPRYSGKEALPWWFFGLLGGLATEWLLTPLMGPWLGLPSGEPGASATGEVPGGIKASLLTWGANLALFLPGAVAGGALGWLIIRPVNWALGKFFWAFNRAFDWATQGYGKTVGSCLRLSFIVLLVYVGLLGLTGLGFTSIPSGFVPVQDKGYLLANIQLPDSASLERTAEVADAVERIALETPGVAHTVATPGTSFVLNANSSNYGNMFIILKPFHERRDPSLSGEAILKRLRARLKSEVPDARVLVFGAPAVRGLGNAGGFKLMVEATGDVNYDALQAQADNLTAKGNKQPGLVGLFDGFRARTPQLYVDIDREKVKTMGVPLNNVFDALQAYLGSYYVNDFNRFGRTWQVNVQADAPFRTDADTVRQLKVRNADGDMVPLGAVADVRESYGPVQVTRYNTFPAATITGASLPDMSTGDVLATMGRLADQELPKNMTYEWTELSYLQQQAAKADQFRDLQQNPTSAFVLGAVLVFFVLAGLYEGWSLPFSVILVVPMCVLCALAGVAFRGLDNNLFTQIGFVVLIGLACKNAILIVEFARDRQLEGASVFDAALEAARVRLRPIVMTTMCFIHMAPPYFASGAGAEMRRSVGTAMLWGAFGVTLFGIFLTPVFFYVIRRLAGPVRKPTREPTAVAADGSFRAHALATAVVPASSNGEPGS